MKQRKRGGQPKHWADEARVWTWYWIIRQASGWSDYKLDSEFAWKGEGAPPTTHRLRIFEWIRKTAREPKGNSGKWRSMAELVDVVDQHPWFKGTKALYEADLWTLFKESSITPNVLFSRINRILETHDLVQIPFDELSAKSEWPITEHRPVSIYERCLMLSTQKMALWIHIELVWYLFILNEPTQNREFRSALESIIDISLNLFFLKYLPDRHLDYYPDAIHALLNTKLDISSMDGGYGYLASQGGMPVIPKRMVGKVEEKHLYDADAERL